MKFILIAGLIAVASAAKLSNNYLPPHSAKTAGGSGTFLNTPFGGSPFKSASSGPVHGGHVAPKSAEAGAAILRFNNDNKGDGSYQFEYETQNKISHNEAGQLKNAGSENEAEEVHGSYSYTAPDGQVITVSYIANEFGFQPTGDHLPTPPPVPEAILKSLQLIAASESSQSSNGQYQSNGQYRSNNINNQYVPPSANSGYRY